MITFLSHIKRYIFITKIECAYCAGGTESLNIFWINLSKGLVISTEEYIYAHISCIRRHRYKAFFMVGCS